MRLDETDSHILELKGNAKDIMRDIFGEELGASNAGKQLAGIRKYLRYKEGQAEETVLPRSRKYGAGEKDQND